VFMTRQLGLRELIRAMWIEDPEKRPPMSEVRHSLFKNITWYSLATVMIVGSPCVIWVLDVGFPCHRGPQVYSQLIKQSKGLSPMAVRPISSSSLVA
jgi:hypothetical protein